MKYCFILLLLLACNKQPTTESPQPTCVDCTIHQTETQASTPIGPEYPIKNAKKVFTVSIKDTNYTAAQKANIWKASELIATVVNSDEFKTRIQNTAFTLTANTALSKNGSEVFEHLFNGAEALMPALNYQMDLTVTMYTKKFSKVIGYTTPSTLIVYTNSKFHNLMSVCAIAGNLFHEWTHKMGYDHLSAQDYTSVPYAAGYLLEELCLKTIK